MIDADGAPRWDFASVDHGTGHPVVLVHAFPTDRRLFAGLAARVGHARLLVPDLPGFGETRLGEHAPAVLSVELLADALAAWLESLALGPVVVGGNEFGGYIALAIADRRPDLVDGLVMIGCRAAPAAPDKAGEREAVARLALDSGSLLVADRLTPLPLAPSVDERTHAIVRRMIEEADPRAIAGLLRGMEARPHPGPALERLRVPLLVIAGTDDPCTVASPTSAPSRPWCRVPSWWRSRARGTSHRSSDRPRWPPRSTPSPSASRDRAPPVVTARYDVVVIGGGSAGCVVAARLSEDPSRRVLLVEAGGDPRPVPDIIGDPRRQGDVILDPALVRHYPVKRPDGSSFRLVSGRVMGGGSAVNNLSFQRPIGRDFEAWASFGGPAWSYDALLPLLRAMEDEPDFGDEPHHGRGGPIRMMRPWRPSDPSDPPARALVDAALATGLPLCEDPNVPEPFGVCATPYAIVDGRRQTVADAYLGPARARPNLTILSGATATRVLLDGRRACGVELTGPGGRERVEAAEVILAAGAYQTPHLLLLSGIGPPSKVESVGLAVAHRLDGVGENFQDHAVVPVAFAGRPALRPEHRMTKLRFIAKSDPALDHGDLHLNFRPPKAGPDGALRLGVTVRLVEHRSRGRVRLASAEPAELPLVEPSILADPGDVAAIVRGIECLTRLIDQPAAAAFFGPRVSPPPGADLAAHARSTFVTYNHGSGTCRFGPDGDPLAVVDPSLRVRGLDGLWIADASVLPVIPHAATNLSAVLVGEVAARNIGGAGG